MSRWYRAYEGTVTDAKIGEAALVAGCSRSVAIATWHAILESAAGQNDGGRFDTTPRRVAAVLCEPLATIEAVFAALGELGMIADSHICAWQRRQHESDSSTERSRRFRERQRNGHATLQQRSVTPPDTETDITVANATGADAPSAPDPTIAERELFARGKAVLGNSAGGQINKLLRHRGGNVALARSDIERASQAHDPPAFVAGILRSPPSPQGKSHARSNLHQAVDFASRLADEFREREQREPGMFAIGSG